MSVDKSDLEAKLKEIEEVIDETTEAAKNTGIIIAVVAVVVVLAVFVLGRKKGRKGSARVEVYRLG